jgi:PKD repeat protein
MQQAFLLLSLSAFFSVQAQCPIADFAIPASACRHQQLEVLNLSAGATTYEWDFCSGDLDQTPQVNIVASNTLLFRTRSFRLLQQNNTWYAFAIDQAANKLIRFYFGNSLTNTPVITDLGNPAGILNGAFDFSMHEEGGNWYALVVNTGSNSLVRFSFGTNIESSPSVQNLGTLGGVLNTPNAIILVNDNGFLRAFVSNGGVAEMVRLDFGSSVLNTPAVSTFAVPGASNLRGIAITRECDRWFGLVTSYNNNKVFWLDFVNGLAQPAQTGEITFFTSYNFPATIALAADGGEYYAFIQSAVGPMYRLSFGASIIDKSGTGENLGNLGISNENWPVEMIKLNSDWNAFTVDFTNRRLIRLSFPLSCGENQSISTASQPVPVQYTTGGVKKIALKAYDLTGAVQHTAKTVTITPALAPDIAAGYQNNCAQHDVLFSSVNGSGNLTGYAWDFGDTNVSTLPNPVHTYGTPGNFDVRLEVTADNGCTNFSKLQVLMVEKPAADFLLPSNPVICTNQEYFFQNTTAFNPAIEPAWTWLINGSMAANTRDLYTMFSSPASQEVTLQASIPGCMDEAVKTIGTVEEGPLVDFVHTGQCAEAVVEFTNQTVGQVSNYMWQFGDSQASTDENPSHSYAMPGNYAVTLTAANAAGCANSKARTVTIYSRPQTDFTVALPPFSCSGSPTQFTDATPGPSDSNIASWFWDFDDGGSTATLKNPQHTYITSGTYNVSLTATTNFGCSRTIQKPVFISPSPAVDFSFSPPCRSVPVSFTDLTPGTTTSWLWQIESSFYTTQNPVHTFTTSGNKTVTLTVTGANGCTGSRTQSVGVPQILVPDFLTDRTCTNQQTLFTDNTNDFADPVTSRQWTFGTFGSGTGNPQAFTFPATGNFNVNLTVTTQTGCSYSRLKNVTISAPPVAGFNASPVIGEPPLTVVFTNTSSGATSYLWKFGDASGSTSTETSPQFIFNQLGQYSVELSAMNALNCTSQAYRTINVVIPVIDVELSLLELLTTGNSVVPAVTLVNRSNVPVQNPVVRFDLSGNSAIDETIVITLPSNSSYRHVAGFSVPLRDELNYVCAEVLIDDITPDDNRTCSAVEGTFTALEPYPNPVLGKQPVTVAWISTTDGTAVVSLLNSSGQQVFSSAKFSSAGFNTMALPTDKLSAGVYIVRITSGNRVKSFRLAVGE